MLHGRGYTCCSMRSTDRTCRRFIGWTCTVSGSTWDDAIRRFPGDLGIALAQVHRSTSPASTNSSRSMRPAASSTQRDDARHRRTRGRRLGALEARELVAVRERRRRPRAAAPRPGREVGDELGGREHLVVGHPLHATGHRAYAAWNTSRRRASSTATTRRVVRRSGYATRSRLGTGTTGTRSAWAITLAVVTPTRSPVNIPGPMPDRDGRQLRRARRPCLAQPTRCPARAARRGGGRPTIRAVARPRCRASPSATLTRGVAVSIARIIMPHALTDAASALMASLRSRHDGPTGVDRDLSSSASPGVDPDLEAVDGPSAAAATSPHSTTRTPRRRSRSSEPEVVQLLHVVEPVHVDVHEREPTLVLTHDRERRAHDHVAHPEAGRDALREHRLARAPRSPTSEDDVAGAQEPATRSASAQVSSARRGHDHDRADQLAASARLIVTKSARASASAAPPLRSTAAGCSTGMRTVSPSRRELLAAQLRDAVLGVEQELGREVPQRHHHLRSQEAELGLEVRAARLDLARAGGRGCPVGGTSRRSRCTRRRG